jgi:hypothetical protein
MHKIKEKMMEELKMLEKQIEKKDNISAGDLELVHKLTDTIKNIDKICMLEDEDEGEYSERSYWMGDGKMYGTSYDDGRMNGSSYARGRGRYAKRDSMGRYSRDDGMSYGESYARDGRGGGRYSQADGKAKMIEHLEDLAEDADTKSREAIHRAIKQIENA